MLARLQSFATIGLQAVPVIVEVDMAPGLNTFNVVGLGDAAVQESKERVRSALKNSGFGFPSGRRVTVNLAPADLKKVGPRYDLPIALGVMIASRTLEIDPSRIADTVFLGELALDGTLRHVSGLLCVAMSCRQRGVRQIVVPLSNSAEAKLVPGLEVVGVSCLAELTAILRGERLPQPIPSPASAPVSGAPDVDFADIRGQGQAKRAMEIAAAGCHNILLSGAPGAGKTLLAKALAGILPPLTTEESLEVTQIYSVADLMPADTPLIQHRPFRSVHHTASGVSIVGGGQIPGPGEISLAHRGVLFLDELAEFPSSVLEVLRQPLEEREITITRAQGSVRFPADFLLVAAMNPPEWSGGNARKIKRRISPPLLDRIDLTIDVQPVEVADLEHRSPDAETSAQILDRVRTARERQRARFAGTPTRGESCQTTCSEPFDSVPVQGLPSALRSHQALNERALQGLEQQGKLCRTTCGERSRTIRTNAEMRVQDLDRLCPLSAGCLELLRRAMQRMRLSARGYHRTIKVARTIADLAASDEIREEHIAEALQYRQSVGVE